MSLKIFSKNLERFFTAVGLVLGVVGLLPWYIVCFFILATIVVMFLYDFYMSRRFVNTKFIESSIIDSCNLADKVIKPEFNDYDEKSRVYCESILYQIETIKITSINENERYSALYALSLIYMKLIVYFTKKPDGNKNVLKLEGQLVLLEKQVSRYIKTEGCNPKKIHSNIEFSRAIIKKDNNDIKDAINLLENCINSNVRIEIESRARDLLGQLYFKIGKLEDAIMNYKFSYELKCNINDTKGQAICLGNLGRLSMSKLDFDEAIDYFLRDLGLTKELGDFSGEIQCLNHLGDCYFCKQEIIKANYYFDKAIERINSYNFTNLYGEVFANLGLWQISIFTKKNPKNYSTRINELLDNVNLGLKELIVKYMSAVKFINRQQDMIDKMILEKYQEIVTETKDINTIIKLYQIGLCMIEQEESQRSLIMQAEDYFKMNNYDHYRNRLKSFKNNRALYSDGIVTVLTLEDLFAVEEIKEKDENRFIVIYETIYRVIYLITKAITGDYQNILIKASLGVLQSEIHKMIESYQGDDYQNYVNYYSKLLSRWSYKNRKICNDLSAMRNELAHHGFNENDLNEFLTVRDNWLNNWADFGKKIQFKLVKNDLYTNIFITINGIKVDLMPYFVIRGEGIQSVYVIKDIDEFNCVYVSLLEKNLLTFEINDFSKDNMIMSKLKKIVDSRSIK